MAGLDKWSHTFLWLFITSALITNAFETYDDTDRQAEESALYEDEELEETTTFANFLTEETTIQSSNKIVEYSIPAEMNESNSENEDPLQKILPKVKFNCKGKPEGYYADTKFCELFHYCKTNGFRFTFICPPNSYYNQNVMACEYNSTINSKYCENSGKKSIDNQNDNQNNHQNNNQNNNQNNTEDIHSSADERVEVYQTMRIDAKNDKWNSISTSTISSINTTADPFLKKWRTTYGTRVKQEESDLNNKSLPFNEQTNGDTISGFSLNTDNNVQNSEYTTLLPFKGFAKSNRWLNNRNNQTDPNSKTSIKSGYDHQIQLNSAKTSSIGWPFDNSAKNEFQKNYSSYNNPHSMASSYKTSMTSTTTPFPSLLTPTTKGATTVSYSTTSSSFESSNPLDVFESEKETQSKTNSYELNFRNPVNQQVSDQKTQYDSHVPKRPVSQPIRFSQLLSESLQRQRPMNKHFGLPRTQTESKSTPSLEFPPFIPREVISQEFLGYNFFNRQPLFDDVFENQQIRDSNSFKSPTLNGHTLSNSRVRPLSASNLKVSELIGKFQQMYAEDSEVSMHRVLPPLELKSGVNQSKSGTNFNRNDQISVISIPLLVPKGLSKNHFKQSIKASLLKPTTIPSTKNGQQIPAYVLHLQNSQQSIKTKTRPKRQTFGFGNPYIENPFLTNNHYFPMLSAVPENNFFNYFSNGLPLSGFDETPLRFGNKPDLRLNPSAQQNLPYYMPRKRLHVNRPHFDQNIFDLSEFSDFPIPKRTPFNGNPTPLISKPPPNELVRYRSVSFKRPTYKRPPRRNKIPVENSNQTEQISSTKSDTIHTIQSNNVEKITRTAGSPAFFPTSRPFNEQITNNPQILVNSNPFSQITNANIGNIGDAIKLFDSSDNSFQPLSPSAFNSQSLFKYNSPKSNSNAENIQSIRNAFTGRHSMNNMYSELQTNSNNNQRHNNYILQQFPPIPQFGDPDFRLPYTNILDPSLRNVVYPPKSNQYHQQNVGAQQDNRVNRTSFEPSPRPINYYQPENIQYLREDNEINKESEKNPNHNYDKDVLQTARTHGITRKIEPNTRSNWNSILTQFNSPNITITKSVSYSTKVEDNNNKNDGSDKENSVNQRPLSFGARLKDNSNLTISVKSSIRSVSSLTPQPSNQIEISNKSDALSISPPKQINIYNIDKNKSNEEILSEKINQNSERFTILNYYKDLNAQKELREALESKSSITSTTTLKPMSTTHWSIRGWTGLVVSDSNGHTLQTTTTSSPMTTSPVNKNMDVFDLFESEASRVETTTQLPQTTPRTESVYRQVFNSFEDITIESNEKTNPQLSALKSKPDILRYLNSLTTHKTI